MEFEYYRQLVKELNLGKKLPSSIYIHKSAIAKLPKSLAVFAIDMADKFNVHDDSWNIIKFYKKDFKISFLNYPGFEQDSYPSLHLSQIIDLHKSTYRKTDYSKSDNPPILHRKETFVVDIYPLKSLFEQITAEGEAIGLYSNPKRIGLKKQWEALIKHKGYKLDEHGRLQRLIFTGTNIEPEKDSVIERHKTALSRNKLSTPLFLLYQRGYLDGDYSILDFGCGQGDDVKELKSYGLDIIGWDPVHEPDTPLSNQDIVNLGYVINVIEDPSERMETLLKAYQYTNKVLLVSAMLGNKSIFERFKPYKDGVITSRNTFQKYFYQSELRHYIESSLGEQAIALSPGIFLVFKDKIEEQKYLINRQTSSFNWRNSSRKPSYKPNEKTVQSVFNNHKELMQDYWCSCLEQGRKLTHDEYERSDEVTQATGSVNKAFHLCLQFFNEEDFKVASQMRREDLLVYFALSFFSKRKAYARMPENLKRDIKEYFGKYTQARDEGRNILFSISNTHNIQAACVEANKILPKSTLNGNHDLIIHKKYLNDCPVILRIYIGCALQLYGELEEVSLIKVHIHSGKVTLMVFDDWNKKIPLLTERIKIKLREQRIDFFDYYGEYEPLPFDNKSCF